MQMPGDAIIALLLMRHRADAYVHQQQKKQKQKKQTKKKK
jgi:hypothetical protein